MNEALSVECSSSGQVAPSREYGKQNRIPAWRGYKIEHQYGIQTFPTISDSLKKITKRKMYFFTMRKFVKLLQIL